MSYERSKATFAQFRAGAADVGTVTPRGVLVMLTAVTADGVYVAPLGTTVTSAPDAPVWVLMTDVSADGAT